MNDQDLNDMIQFLSGASLTDMTVVENVSEDLSYGRHWQIGIFVRAEDQGVSRLYRSQVGPTADISMNAQSVVDGVPTFEQTICASVADGFANIDLHCENTYFVIVEDD